MRTSILQWPGKSPVDGDAFSHPAVYHMLDVGAVAERLLRNSGFGEPLRQALTLLVTLHDIGKIGSEFRAMLEEGATQGYRHWEVSLAWLMHFDESLLTPLLGSERMRRAPLYAAVAGHHGRPPNDEPDEWLKMRERAGPEAERHAGEVIETIAALFPDASLNGLGLTFRKAASWREGAKPLSWWLAGLTSIADWVGSNVAWFPAHEPVLAIEDYWAHARKQAGVALVQSGLEGAGPSDIDSSQIFAFPGFTPMQRAVLDAPLREGQALAVIEDATGSGKTEAALMLAHRMMQAGKGDGLFFALPTTATANAMFARLQSMRRLFGGEPSLALAHGRAGFHAGFREIQGRRAGEPDEMSCAPWFADGRRKALLAHVGVGTIDQALLGVLPTRFSTLRLYALSRRILIVDEAHDYDRYMQTELERLLTFHAMLGGSAILMTATLPGRMRAQLVDAFRRGAKYEDNAKLPDAYPQLSVIGRAGVSTPVEAVPATRRRVAVTRLPSLEAALDALCDAARRGAACAFVRNSVDEAVAAVEALRERGVDAMLHHARFALCDRLANEGKVLARFGKDGAGREGAVIVGTQVLEQSLDIDFDVMVSDLAPIGALIQRAGRLWRHMEERPAASRPVPGPTLHVLSPGPQDADKADWSRDLLGRGFYVYPLPDQWRTAKALFEAGTIDAPDGLRALIAAVYGDDAPDVPDALVKAQNEREGAVAAEHDLALGNVLDAFADYRSAGACNSDETFPTRLAPEQAILALARRTPDGLAPYAEGDTPEAAWALSEVSIALTRWRQSGGVDQDTPEIIAAKKDWPEWKKAKIFVCLLREGGHLSEALKYDEKSGLIQSSPHTRE